MTAWTIEPLTSAEQIDSVLAIEETAFTNPWTRQMYLAELENREVAFCFLAGSADAAFALGASAPKGGYVGFCSFWRVLDELHINNLAVLPEFRRRGVATALLNAVLAHGRAHGARQATLEMRRSNDAARLLYERFGFTVAGTRHAYYTKPIEDAVILVCDDLGSSPGESSS